MMLFQALLSATADPASACMRSQHIMCVTHTAGSVYCTTAELPHWGSRQASCMQSCAIGTNEHNACHMPCALAQRIILSENESAHPGSALSAQVYACTPLTKAHTVIKCSALMVSVLLLYLCKHAAGLSHLQAWCQEPLQAGESSRTQTVHSANVQQFACTAVPVS
jgi:hypothetical protein